MNLENCVSLARIPAGLPRSEAAIAAGEPTLAYLTKLSGTSAGKSLIGCD